MAVYFELDGFQVGCTFFLKRNYVKDLGSGITYYPSPKIMLIFNALVDQAKSLQLPRDQNQFVVSYIASRFIGATMHPKSLPAEMFLSSDPVRFVATALMAVADDAPPPPRKNFWSHIIDKDTELQISKKMDWAITITHGGNIKTAADESELDTYFVVRNLLLTDESIQNSVAVAALNHLNLLFARSTGGHRREQEFMRSTSAAGIKDRVIAYEFELRLKHKL